MDLSYLYEMAVNLSMMAYKLENIAVLNIKGTDYRFVIQNVSRDDAINSINSSKLDDKRSL